MMLTLHKVLAPDESFVEHIDFRNVNDRDTWREKVAIWIDVEENADLNKLLIRKSALRN